MFARNAKCPFAGSTVLQEQRWIAPVYGPVKHFKIPILHRAYEPEKCFTWRKVESVANVAAVISPAALFPEWED